MGMGGKRQVGMDKSGWDDAVGEGDGQLVCNNVVDERGKARVNAARARKKKGGEVIH